MKANSTWTAHIVGRDHDASSWESLYKLHDVEIITQPGFCCPWSYNAEASALAVQSYTSRDSHSLVSTKALIIASGIASGSTPRVTFGMDADVAVALGARTAEGSKASGAVRSKTAPRGKR